MIFRIVLGVICLGLLSTNCQSKESEDDTILGFELLSDLAGHWVGTNQTSFGFYDWFAFDFRPISPSHLHSIYEGGTNQNIITSLFIANHEGRLQIMARNGGWLGPQYRATYFVLDKEEQRENGKYYRLVDAVGKENRAYMEFYFDGDSLRFDAYKDNSGSLDQPLHHMGFVGTNYNPEYAESAISHFDFPQPEAEVNFENAFNNLIDPDSALFLEEDLDPFPKSAHGYISDLTIHIEREQSIIGEPLLFFLSKTPLISPDGSIDFSAVDTQVVRTIDISGMEESYTATYLHPDTYYVTVFLDNDGNFFPSVGDICNYSEIVLVESETQPIISISVNKEL